MYINPSISEKVLYVTDIFCLSSEYISTFAHSSVMSSEYRTWSYYLKTFFFFFYVYLIILANENIILFRPEVTFVLLSDQKKNQCQESLMGFL